MWWDIGIIIAGIMCLVLISVAWTSHKMDQKVKIHKVLKISTLLWVILVAVLVATAESL